MKLKSVHKKLQKNLNKNKKGGIEGLPLQLMIIIIIATLGTAIIVGWMGNIETPKSIGNVDVESGDIKLNSSNSSGYCYVNEVNVFVTDQDGNPLEEATVVLSGLGIKSNNNGTAYAVTNSDGVASFSMLKLKMSGTVGFITVDVSKAGYGEDSSCRITVVA